MSKAKRITSPNCQSFRARNTRNAAAKILRMVLQGRTISTFECPGASSPIFPWKAHFAPAPYVETQQSPRVKKADLIKLAHYWKFSTDRSSVNHDETAALVKAESWA